MRILYLFRSLAVWGGIERILVDKMNYFVSHYGYDVYMLTSDQGNHAIPYHLDESVHFEDLNIRFHQKYQYSVILRPFIVTHLKHLYEKRLAKRMFQIQPDIIVCTTADPIDSIIKLKGKTPLIIESHSICSRTIEQGSLWLSRKWYRYHYLKQLSQAAVVVTLTEGDAVEWRKVHHHVVVIPNMVHLNDGSQSTQVNKRIIFVGRFDYQKRPMEFIRIWRKVHLKHPDWHLDIYGDGEQFSELRQMIRPSDMNILIHQPTSRIFDCYRESSILVSSSLFEPFGLVIPEAMSCGLPVVAYDCPYGPACFIENGITGFLVKEGSVDDFVNKLCLLMEDNILRTKMAKASVTVSKRFSAAKIMPQWNRLFSQLLD